MATVAEVRQQITTQRQEIEEARQQIGAIQTRVPLTRTQLATATRMQQLVRKRQEAQIRQAKSRAISQLGRQEVEFEQAVTLTEADITRQETAIAAARAAASRPSIYQALEGALSGGRRDGKRVAPSLSGKQAYKILLDYGYTDPSERAKIMRQFSAQVYGGVYTKGGTGHYVSDKVDVVALPAIISPHVTIPSSEFKKNIKTWEAETGGKIELMGAREGYNIISYNLPNLEKMTPEQYETYARGSFVSKDIEADISKRAREGDIVAQELQKKYNIIPFDVRDIKPVFDINIPPAKETKNYLERDAGKIGAMGITAYLKTLDKEKKLTPEQIIMLRGIVPTNKQAPTRVPQMPAIWETFPSIKKAAKYVSPILGIAAAPYFAPTLFLKDVKIKPPSEEKYPTRVPRAGDYPAPGFKFKLKSPSEEKYPTRVPRAGDYPAPAIWEIPSVRKATKYTGAALGIGLGIAQKYVKIKPPSKEKYPTRVPNLEDYKMPGGIFSLTEKSFKYEEEVAPKIRELEATEEKMTLLQRQDLFKKLEKEYDVKTKFVLEEGKIKIEREYPLEFQKLRPGWEKKEERETVVSWISRDIGFNVGKLAEKEYQSLAYKPITFGQEYTAESSKKFGKFVGVLASSVPYFIPFTRPIMILGGTVEAATRGGKGFIKFVKEEPLTVGIAATYGALKTYQGVRYARQPVNVAMSRTIKVGKAVQVKEPVIIKSGVWKSGYAMRAEATRKFITVPRWQTWVGEKPLTWARGQTLVRPKGILKAFLSTKKYPIKVKTVKYDIFTTDKFYATEASRTVYTKTIKGWTEIVGEKPMISIQRVGSKMPKFYELTGKGKVLAIEDWKSLTKANIKTLQRIVKTSTNSKKLPTIAQTKKYLETSPVSLSRADTQSLFKVRGLEIRDYKDVIPNLGLPSPGRTRTSTQLISVVPEKSIGTQGEWKVYRGITLAGKRKPYFPIKELIFEKTPKPGIDIGEYESLARAIPWKGKAFPYISQELVRPELVRPELVPSMSEISKKLYPIATTFAGAGLSKIPSIQIIAPRLKYADTSLFAGAGLLSVTRTDIKPEIKFDIMSDIKQQIKPEIKPVTPSPTTPIPQQIPVIKQVPKIIPIQIPTQIPTQIPRQIPKITPKQIPILVPIKIPITKLGLGGMSREKLGRIISKAFEVQVRRGGVFKTISKKALPKGKALKLGSKRVRETLAATFRLKEKGVTKERDIGFKLSSKFRLPKSGEKLTFIEKKPYRLKKGTQEIPEILAIRGKKKKGRKFKWI